MAIEEAVLKETGPEVGGNMHVAKSRNDQVTTAIRMQLRNELIAIMLKVIEMQKNLLETASKHIDTVILEYTHLASRPTSHFRSLFIIPFSSITARFRTTASSLWSC